MGESECYQEKRLKLRVLLKVKVLPMVFWVPLSAPIIKLLQCIKK